MNHKYAIDIFSTTSDEESPTATLMLEGFLTESELELMLDYLIEWAENSKLEIMSYPVVEEE